MPRHGANAVLRRFPLFPRYLLLRIDEAGHSALRIARGLRKLRPVLAADDGQPWRCPADIVTAIMAAECRDEFDEIIVKGDNVRLMKGALAGIVAGWAHHRRHR